MDKIFYNGKIRTLNSADAYAEAVGIDNGKIAFVGPDQEAKGIPCRERTDLGGRLMLPGFVDSHIHMLHYAFVEKSVKLFHCKSVEETLEAASAKLKENAEGTLPWLFCRGWNEELFKNPRYPLKSDLDKLSDKIPVIMVRVCGHAAVLNTPGLDLLRQIKEFPEIENEIDFKTGLIKENAVDYFYSALKAPPLKEIKALIRTGAKRLNQKGITGIQSDDLGSLPGKDWRRVIEAFRSLDAEKGLKLRVYEQCLFERLDELKVFIAEGYRTGQQGRFFTIGPVKLIQDGSLGAKTAALRKPYEGEADNAGIVIREQGELDRIVKFCDDNHMQLAVHCIGDRALDMVIKAVEKSPSRRSNPKGRHGIVHAQITDLPLLKRMKENDMLAYIQPVFVNLDMGIVEPRIGACRMKNIYAWKTMLDMGIHTSGGSDAPVVGFDIMENIYFAVTRKNILGKPDGGWLPGEKLSVEEAVKLFAKYPAYASFSEDVNGSIETGKNADLVVLNENVYETEPDHIKDIKADMTIVGGETVYCREK